MALNIDQEVARMRQMTVGQLREKYAEVFREETSARNKQWMIKRIAWRMQANEEGGLSERARRRALELANDADLRVTIPRGLASAAGGAERTSSVRTAVRPLTSLLPGTMLTRDYKGRAVHVTVLHNGFEWEGERYKSLSAVAKAVTGKHWNGFHFFGLRREAGGRRREAGGGRKDNQA